MKDDATLVENAYGKAGIRLVQVHRGPERHEIQDLTVQVRLLGDFEAAYTAGDNRRVLPTDTMKNTVYGLARERSFEEIEEFALALSEHFLTASPPARQVEVEIEQHPWQRALVGDRAHPHAFVRGSAERRLAKVTRRRHAEVAVEIEAGLADLRVLKTTDSAFTGFPRDRFTTLEETEDRIFATTVEARWRYEGDGLAYGPLAHGIRRTLIETFAGHSSLSVQHTLNAMAQAVLASHAAVAEIRLVMPNVHHLKVDLTPFDLDNPNRIFVATEAPYGLIEGVYRR